MKSETFKASKKHLAIFKTIAEKGFYRPTYSDLEPATQNLIKRGIVEWRGDYRGVIFTEQGMQFLEKEIKGIFEQIVDPIRLNMTDHIKKIS